MKNKKLIFYCCFFVNITNLAENENFDENIDRKSYILTGEEKILIKDYIYNTRKWGTVYVLFPQVKIMSAFVLFGKYYIGNLKINFFGLFFHVVEYKYMFNKFVGLNVRWSLNPEFLLLNEIRENVSNCVFSIFTLNVALEWIYGRIGQCVFSGSISPIGFSPSFCMYYINGKKHLGPNILWGFWGSLIPIEIFLFKFEYNKSFYMNLGKIRGSWNFLSFRKEEFDRNDFLESIGRALLVNVFSIEFGFNTCGISNHKFPNKIISKNNKIKKTKKQILKK